VATCRSICASCASASPAFATLLSAIWPSASFNPRNYFFLDFFFFFAAFFAFFAFFAMLPSKQ
jgi:hypothetical protein